MASELVELADAVVTALNAQLPDWGVGAAAIRSYHDAIDLKDSGEVCITVLVNSTIKKQYSRGTLEARPRIDIDVRRHVGIDSSKTLRDAVLTLIERIEEFSLMRTFTEYAGGTAACVETESTSAYQLDAMRTANMFAAVCSLTFQVIRSPK